METLITDFNHLSATITNPNNKEIHIDGIIKYQQLFLTKHRQSVLLPFLKQSANMLLNLLVIRIKTQENY